MKAQGMLAASMNWGKLAAALVGGLIAQYLGILPVFIAALAAAVVCIALSAKIRDMQPAKTEKRRLPIICPRSEI